MEGFRDRIKHYGPSVTVGSLCEDRGASERDDLDKRRGDNGGTGPICGVCP